MHTCRTTIANLGTAITYFCENDSYNAHKAQQIASGSYYDALKVSFPRYLFIYRRISL